MDFAALFDFSHRVTKDTVMVKTVDGQVDRKVVKGSFNWLGFLFTWFYAVLSSKYKTPGFGTKVGIPLIVMIVINLALQVILGRSLSLIVDLVWSVLNGLMFDTWFKQQLIKNGYTEMVNPA
ncbi:hypothetical protein ACFP3T_08410 [Lactiplantibacillus dongliensis]|uniref:Integral membrane protein n=1 Tax=Lactiplantibacillus dongliensis TaxID=2559919 RepID=A0ABW1R5N3_9LACO|nr:hypothetical protein [Lactiplantibacillus dongliensis]